MKTKVQSLFKLNTSNLRLVSRMFQGCFMIKGVSRVFQGSFKKTFKVFQESFMCMALIAASRAEGGLVQLEMPLSQ